MPSSGSFAGIEAETPYPGIRRRTFHSERMTFSEYTFAVADLTCEPGDLLVILTDGLTQWVPPWAHPG